ncbi:hypothetical protein [uncultured Sulfitobacter sp.]|uniref:hypothetical protein n=1 Tax=uncultured Sulfitobacter sp. TaxID=191468 RepID=UPI0030FA309F
MHTQAQPTLPQAKPSDQFLSDARMIAANPEQYHDRPILRRLAWMTLMAARGHSVNQRRLALLPAETQQ